MTEKTCRIGVFNNDYSEPEMKLSDKDFPRADIEGLMKGTHVIVPKDNQEKE